MMLARVVRGAIFKWAEIREKFLRRNLFISLGDGRETERGEEETLGGKSWMKQSLCNLYPSFPALAGILMKGV